MRMTFFSFFSQSDFYMGSRCGLPCRFCDQLSFDSTVMKDAIVSGVFFERFDKTKSANVVGCDLDDYEALSFLLTFLASEQYKIRFWNQGVVDMQVMESIAERCDEVMLYCPSVDEKIYQEHSTDSTFEELLDVLNFLKDESCDLKLYTPVNQEYIGDLPDIHEFARAQGVDLILSCDTDELSRDQLDIVNRYFNISGVDVYKRKHSEGCCKALPFPVFKSPRIQLKNKISNYLSKTR